MSYDVIDNTTLPHKKLGISSTGAGMVATTFQELHDQRIVRTHDSRMVPLDFGNRAARRMVGRADRGNPKKPKQFHKQGHA